MLQDLRLAGQAVDFRDLRENHHQQIIEVVGDPAYQPTNYLHFLGLPHLLFESFSLPDIAKDALNDLFPFKLRQARVDLDRKRAPIGMIQVHLLPGNSGTL